MATDIEKFRKNFEKWCGFSLESDNYEDIMDEIRRRKWDLECEINQQAKVLESEIKLIFPQD